MLETVHEDEDMLSTRGRGMQEDTQRSTRFIARLNRGVGDQLGATLGDTPVGAVIINVLEGGLLAKWNKKYPNTAFRRGFIIEEVNGVKGYWNLLDVMQKQGPLEIKVTTVPPAIAGPRWLEAVASMAKTIEQ